MSTTLAQVASSSGSGSRLGYCIFEVADTDCRWAGKKVNLPKSDAFRTDPGDTVFVKIGLIGETIETVAQAPNVLEIRINTGYYARV